MKKFYCLDCKRVLDNMIVYFESYAKAEIAHNGDVLYSNFDPERIDTICPRCGACYEHTRSEDFLVEYVDGKITPIGDHVKDIIINGSEQ